jgi:L-asparaginase
MTPKLVIHGGAGLVESRDFKFSDYDKVLRRIVRESYEQIGEGARVAVLAAIRHLEDNPMFNAGYGSRLQKDGEVRMSAAIMGSDTGRIGGVINIQGVKNPIEVANVLLGRRHRVLSGTEATAFARGRGFEAFNPLTQHRLREHQLRLKGNMGTVGAVAIDVHGVLYAATSTGGIGFETPGRVADSGTVAGTFTSSYAGVSCTGRGEQIMSQAVAVKVVTKVEMGLTLESAINETIRAGNQRRHHYGLIALDCKGKIGIGKTKRSYVLHASFDGSRVQTFKDKR